MKEQKEIIQEYYDSHPKKEWDRLQKDHPYEKYITVHMMDQMIPEGATILDIGGGPGHYSVYYAKKGHEVTLFDLSPENIRFAKKKAYQYGVRFTAMQGDAMDLFVFLMGPMYHLLSEKNRIRALTEAKRVLKPGGLLFTSFILLFGGVVYGLRDLRESICREQEKPVYEACARDESLALDAFTYSYMTTIPDAKKLIGKIPGLTTVKIFGQESILAPYRRLLAETPRKIRLAWYDYAIRFCDKEDFLTHTEHLMIVSRKEGKK